MVTVADQFCHTVFSIQSSAYHTGISVGKGGHCVKEMGHMGGAGIHGCLSAVIISGSMADGDHNFIFQFPDKVQGAFFLWGESHQFDDVSAALIAEAEEFRIRRADMFRRLGSLFLYIYERTFHIDAGDPGHVRGSFHIFYRGEYLQKPFF